MIDKDPEFVGLFETYKDLLFSWLNQRLILICLTHRIAEIPESVSGMARYYAKSALNTGFLIEIDNDWFVATAAHVLKHVETLRGRGREIAGTTLFAGFGHPGRTQSVPVTVHPEKLYLWDDERADVDIALMPLTSSERIELVRAGADAVRPEQYLPPEFEPNMYVLTGFPCNPTDRWAEDTMTDSQIVMSSNQRWPLIPIEPVKHNRTDTLTEYWKDRQFRARRVQLADGEMPDLNGMSGGPIVAVRAHPPKQNGMETVLNCQISLRAVFQEESAPDNPDKVLVGNFVESLVRLKRHFSPALFPPNASAASPHMPNAPSLVSSLASHSGAARSHPRFHIPPP